MEMDYEIDREAIDTEAGEYTVTWFADDDAQQPEDEGFILAVDGWECYGSHSRIDIEHGDVPDIVWSVLRTHGKYCQDSWSRELRSGAALVRYLTLKGHKGVTLVNRDYRPTEPSADRFDRVYGVAWAPDDATSPVEYVKGDLDQWRAWANGDCFGYVVTNPAGQTIESVWGFYDFNREREETLSESVSAAQYDAKARTDQVNTAGAGIVGSI
jgi:hypothetical protein